MASREDEQRLEASSSHRQEPEDEHNYDATVSTPLTFAAFKRRSRLFERESVYTLYIRCIFGLSVKLFVKF